MIKEVVNFSTGGNLELNEGTESILLTSKADPSLSQATMKWRIRSVHINTKTSVSHISIFFGKNAVSQRFATKKEHFYTLQQKCHSLQKCSETAVICMRCSMHGYNRQGLSSLTAALEPGAATVEPEAAQSEHGAIQVEPGKAQVDKESLASDSEATGPLSGSSGPCLAPIANRAIMHFIVPCSLSCKFILSIRKSLLPS